MRGATETSSVLHVRRRLRGWGCATDACASAASIPALNACVEASGEHAARLPDPTYTCAWTPHTHAASRSMFASSYFADGSANVVRVANMHGGLLCGCARPHIDRTRCAHGRSHAQKQEHASEGQWHESACDSERAVQWPQ